MIKLKKVLKENFDLEQDLKMTVLRPLDIDENGDDFEITKDDKGYRHLIIGDIDIIAAKSNEWRGQWQFKFEDKTYASYDAGMGYQSFKKLVDILLKRFYNNASILKKIIQRFDWRYQMSDDMSKYKAAKQDEKEMADLYRSLNEPEKKEIFDFWNANSPSGFQRIEDLDTFMGA